MCSFGGGDVEKGGRAAVRCSEERLRSPIGLVGVDETRLQSTLGPRPGVGNVGRLGSKPRHGPRQRGARRPRLRGFAALNHRMQPHDRHSQMLQRKARTTLWTVATSLKQTCHRVDF